MTAGWLTQRSTMAGTMADTTALRWSSVLGCKERNEQRHHGSEQGAKKAAKAEEARYGCSNGCSQDSGQQERQQQCMSTSSPHPTCLAQR